MAKILIVDSQERRKQSILEELQNDLPSILNRKGLIFEPTNFAGQFLIKLLSQPTVRLALNSNMAHFELEKLINPLLDNLLQELSIFELVDLFLIEKLDWIANLNRRLKQQIITVFASPITVIATVQAQNLNNLPFLLEPFPVKLIDLDQIKEDELFLKIVRELYDS